MKKLFLTLIVVLAYVSSVFAQGYEGVNPNNYGSNWPDFNYHDYLLQEPFVAAIAIDGQIVSLENNAENWSALEVAAFVTTADNEEECRGNLMWLTDEYVLDYGDDYLTIDGFPIYYNPASPGGEIHFKMHDHLNNIDYTECTITYLGESYTVNAGTPVVEGWDDPETPVILNFSSPSVCKIVFGADNTWRENFEGWTTTHTEQGYTNNKLPDCWTLVAQYTGASPNLNNIGEGADTLPQLFYNPAFDASEGEYTLRFKFHSLLAMPELDENLELNSLRLTMHVRQPQTYYHLQVGVMTNLEDEDSFEALAMVDNESTDMEEFVFDFSTYTGDGRYIAFKNVGGSSRNPYCSNYIDDIVLSYIPENEVIYCGIDGLPWEETFDEFVVNAGTSGVEPNCWEVVGDRSNLDLSTKPQIYHGFSHSGDYSLRMRNRCVYAMPALLLDAQDVTLSLYLRQPKAVYSLQVGVVDEQGNFTTIEELNNESTDIEFREVVLGDLASGTRVAFRNVLNGRHYKYSYNYLDNVKLTGVMTPAKSVSDMTDDATSYLESIVVYPNPTTGVLHIDAMDVQKVECYNTMGQLVGVYDNARDINMGSLSEGVYTLRITVPQGVTMRKVVKR